MSVLGVGRGVAGVGGLLGGGGGGVAGGGGGGCGCPVSNTPDRFGQRAEMVSPTILMLSPFIIEGNGKAVSADR